MLLAINRSLRRHHIGSVESLFRTPCSSPRIPGCELRDSFLVASWRPPEDSPPAARRSTPSAGSEFVDQPQILVILHAAVPGTGERDRPPPPYLHRIRSARLQLPDLHFPKTVPASRRTTSSSPFPSRTAAAESARAMSRRPAPPPRASGCGPADHKQDARHQFRRRLHHSGRAQ